MTNVAVSDQVRGSSASTGRWVGGVAAALLLWAFLYSQLVPFSDWAVSLLPVERKSPLGEAISFFIYDTPKVLLLLTLVVFGMGVVRSFFSPEKTRAMLAGRREGVGNVLAAGLGILTPFCSCCDAAADMVKTEAAKLGVEIKVEKVTDYAAIAQFGIASTPGIVIDGKVVHAGGLPKSADLAIWLQR